MYAFLLTELAYVHMYHHQQQDIMMIMMMTMEIIMSYSHAFLRFASVFVYCRARRQVGSSSTHITLEA